jgi:tRNA (Thr-GGU) A37 N-methylase
VKGTLLDLKERCISGIHENIIDVGGLDMLDGTPILDIKPYTTPPDGWEQRFF